MRRQCRSPAPRAIRLSDGGGVAVEYSLTLPILLALIYGIVEVSHFAYLKLSVSNTAHDAVRYAVVHSSASSSPDTSSAVSTYAQNELNALGLTASATITVTYGPSSNSPGSTVEVQISYPFAPFMPGFNRIPGTNDTFTAMVGPIGAVSEMVFSQ